MRTFLDAVELAGGGTSAGSPILTEAGLNTHFRGAWSAAATYAVNDFVTYSGSTYRATTAIAPSATFQAGFTLVAAKGIDGTFANSYKGTYSDATTYAAGDIVTYNGSTYMANRAAGLLANTLQGLALAAANFTATQNTGTAYAAVNGQAGWYASVSSVDIYWTVDFGAGNTYPISNITFTPSQTVNGFVIQASTDSNTWATIYTWPGGTQNGSARSITPSNTTTAYRYVRMLFPAGFATPSLTNVNMNLTTYRRPADGSGSWTVIAAKGTDGAAGTNGTNGTNGADGLSFTYRGAYSAGTSYSPRDVVTYNGSSYIALLANGSPTATPPSDGLSNATWAVLALKGADGAAGTTGTTGAGTTTPTVSGTLYLRAFYDDFNRTDGTIGGDWAGDNTVARVISNQLGLTVANTVANIYKSLPSTDQAVMANVSALPTDSTVGFLLRFLDANNFLYVAISTTGTINAQYNLAGTYTTVIAASAAGWVAAGDQIRASVVGTTITLENLSRPTASATLTGALPASGAVAARGTGVGLRLYSTVANAPFRFDNFSAYAIESAAGISLNTGFSRLFLFGGR